MILDEQKGVHIVLDCRQPSRSNLTPEFRQADSVTDNVEHLFLVSFNIILHSDRKDCILLTRLNIDYTTKHKNLASIVKLYLTTFKNKSLTKPWSQRSLKDKEGPINSNNNSLTIWYNR